MIEVTDTAAEKIKEYLNQNNIDSAIRIAAMQGCGGASLGLALDDKKDNDSIVEHGGIEVVIDNQLLTACEEVKIDFVEPTGAGCACNDGGFSVSAAKPLEGSGDGCGGSCGSSCGC